MFTHTFYYENTLQQLAMGNVSITFESSLKLHNLTQPYRTIYIYKPNQQILSARIENSKSIIHLRCLVIKLPTLAWTPANPAWSYPCPQDTRLINTPVAASMMSVHRYLLSKNFCLSRAVRSKPTTLLELRDISIHDPSLAQAEERIL